MNGPPRPSSRRHPDAVARRDVRSGLAGTTVSRVDERAIPIATCLRCLPGESGGGFVIDNWPLVRARARGGLGAHAHHDPPPRGPIGVSTRSPERSGPPNPRRRATRQSTQAVPHVRAGSPDVSSLPGLAASARCPGACASARSSRRACGGRRVDSAAVAGAVSWPVDLALSAPWQRPGGPETPGASAVAENPNPGTLTNNHVQIN